MQTLTQIEEWPFDFNKESARLYFHKNPDRFIKLMRTMPELDYDWLQPCDYYNYIVGICQPEIRQMVKELA